MNIHKNVRLTPLGRERIARQIESGQPPEVAARRLARPDRILAEARPDSAHFALRGK